MIIDVTGADADHTQTAELFLWPPRNPHEAVKGGMGILSQSWIDNKAPGASGLLFGALSAVTAEGRSLSAVITDPRTITLSFKPSLDGHFRIIVAAPHYNGSQTIWAAVTPLRSQVKCGWGIGSGGMRSWLKAATMKITSADGVGEHMENLRNIYLYAAVAEKGKEYPGIPESVPWTLRGTSIRAISVGDCREWFLRPQRAGMILLVAHLSEPSRDRRSPQIAKGPGIGPCYNSLMAASALQMA